MTHPRNRAGRFTCVHPDESVVEAAKLVLHEHATYQDAAQAVGMSRRQLYRRLRQLDDVLAARRAEEEHRARFEMSYENVLALIDPRGLLPEEPEPAPDQSELARLRQQFEDEREAARRARDPDRNPGRVSFGGGR